MHFVRDLSTIHPQILTQLITAGADPNLKNKNGDFPILILSRKDIKTQDVISKFITLLLKKGSKVNLFKDQKVKGKDFKETALVAATQQGSVNIVKLLLKFGASIDIPTASKTSASLFPLGLSIQLKHIELTKVLLEHGASQCYNSSTSNQEALEGCMDIAVGTRDYDMIQLIGLYAERVKKIHNEL